MIPKPPILSAQYVGRLPRNWDLAYGYRIEQPARWLAAYWQPAEPAPIHRGDEAICDDGRTSFDANWAIYLDLVDRRLRIPYAMRGTLGSSDDEATHCLLCDLQSRHVFVSPLSDAGRFLHHQHSPAARGQALPRSIGDWTPKNERPKISTIVPERRQQVCALGLSSAQGTTQRFQAVLARKPYATTRGTV